jgi:hypothetical protein
MEATAKVSLWDRLHGKKPPQPLVEKPVEERFYNPLSLHIGDFMDINDIDLPKEPFEIVEIAEYKRVIGGETFLFTDYIVVGRPIGQEPINLRVRLMPTSNPRPGSDQTHYVVLLKKFDEFEYSEDFEGVINDTDNTGTFEVTDEGENEPSKFWRVNDVKKPYSARVSNVRDKNRDSKVEISEVRLEPIEYWDFWRDTLVESVKMTDWVFVEKNTNNGWFTIWRGREIDSTRIVA